MSVVCNATPLIYLAKIGKLYLLRKVFSEVIIPEEVRVEVVEKGKLLGERDAYMIENAIGEGWIKVLRAEPMEVPIKLEAGEVAVLSLAKKLNVEDVLIDEASARMAARLMGLKPRGTIYVLLKALEIRELSLNGFMNVLNELVKHGFRLKEEVYLEAIKKAREIAKENR